MKLTVVGCSGSYPGPDSPASCYLLEADARRPHLAGAAGPRQRCPRPPAAARRPARHRRGAAQPPARRPLPRPLRLLRAAQVPPPRPAAAAPRLRARGHRRADGPRLRPARGPGDEPGVRLPDLDAGRAGPVGPFTVEPIRVEHPVEAYGAAGHRRAARPLAYTGDTGAARSSSGGRAAPTCCWPRRRSATATTNPPGIHLTGADAARLARAPGSSRLVLTHVPPWHDPRDMLAEAAARSGTARAELARRARRTTSRPESRARVPLAGSV